MCGLLLAASLLLCVYAGLGAGVAQAGILQVPGEAAVPAPGSPTPAPEPAAPAHSQGAWTDQSASADASATQQQPVNVVVSVRIDSPGNDGPISQRNIVVGVSGASNDAATNQDAGAADGSASQDASTAQQAGSAANASQQQPTNVVVVVRINSPGNNGPITQDNVDVAVANADNASKTDQDASGSTGGSTSAPATKPQQPVRSSARAPKRRPARKPVKVAPQKKQPVAASRPASGPSAASAAASPGSSYDSTSSGSAAPVAKPVVKHPKAQAPVSEHRRAKPARRARSDGARAAVPQRLAGGAVHLLDSVTSPIRTTGAEAAGRKGSSSSVSGAVVSSLLVVLAAVAAFLAWPYLSRRLQLPGLRWRG